MIGRGQGRSGEYWHMSPAAIGLIIIFLVVGCVVGWYSQKTTAAHGDVKVAKTRLAGGRRTRWRSGIVVVILGLVVLLAVKDVLHPH
jgi:ABC-type Fe3+ transport system permease subunit